MSSLRIDFLEQKKIPTTFAFPYKSCLLSDSTETHILIGGEKKEIHITELLILLYYFG